MDLPILYINLAQRPDRRAFMERQFGELNLGARRIEAVSAADLMPADIERYCNPKAVHCLSRSQLACWQSHLRAWRALIETGAPWGLVLEDDAVISPRLPEFLAAFFAERGPAASYDLIQLETMARRTRLLPAVTTVAGVGLRPFLSTIWGTAGYMISFATARKLLSRGDLFHGPADQLLFRPYTAPGRDFRMVLADPALCVQVDKIEDNGVARGNVAPRRPAAPLPTELARRLTHLGVFAQDLAAHLSHLGRGLSAEIVPFDTPDRRYVGSRVRQYGKELSG